MIEIDKAFEGRWRIKAKDNVELIPIALPVDIKELCRDFFEAGLALGARDYVPLDKIDMAIEMPLTPEESDILKVEDDFDKWWKLYDLKCGKENCIKKWKKLTAKEQLDCIKATPAYVASTPDKQFRKRPLTYLNQKAWKDEIIVKNGNQPTKQQQDLNKLASILTD